MKSVWLVALVILALVLPACSIMSPEAELLAARQKFTAAVQKTTVIREKGGFTKSVGADVATTARYGLAILDEWDAQIALEREQIGVWRFIPRVEAYREKFREVLRRLTAYQLAGKRYLATKATATKADSPEPKPGG